MRGKISTQNNMFAHKLNVHNLGVIMGEYPKNRRGYFHHVPINGKLRLAMIEYGNTKFAIKITWKEADVVYQYRIHLHPTGTVSIMNAVKLGIAQQILGYLYAYIKLHKKIAICFSGRKVKNEVERYLREQSSHPGLVKKQEFHRINEEDVVPDEEAIFNLRGHFLDFFGKHPI
jgi:hypothetical protein